LSPVQTRPSAPQTDSFSFCEEFYVLYFADILESSLMLSKNLLNYPYKGSKSLSDNKAKLKPYFKGL